MHSQVFLRRGVLLGVVTTAALAALLRSVMKSRRFTA